MGLPSHGNIRADRGLTKAKIRGPPKLIRGLPNLRMGLPELIMGPPRLIRGGRPTRATVWAAILCPAQHFPCIASCKLCWRQPSGMLQDLCSDGGSAAQFCVCGSGSCIWALQGISICVGTLGAWRGCCGACRGTVLFCFLYFSLSFFFFLFFKLGAAALLSAHTTAFNELALLIFVRCLLSIFNVQWCIAIVREGSLSTTPLERETS